MNPFVEDDSIGKGSGIFKTYTLRGEHRAKDPENHPDPLFRPSTRRNLNQLFEAYKAGGRAGLEEMHRRLFKKK